MLTGGLRYDQMREFCERHNIKVFNLTIEGVASGQFALQIIKRWGLRPKLWIINADDFGQSFFSDKMDDYGQLGDSSSLNVVTYGRTRGYFNVIFRNLLWRAELLVEASVPQHLWSSAHVPRVARSWRSAKDGSAQIDSVPAYASANPAVVVKRDQNCHADQPEIELAQRYLKGIGGEVVLTLAPYDNFCPKRVSELARALETETMIPTPDAYTSSDGVHLDKAGAVRLTEFFLSALERTAAFKRVLDGRGQTK